MTLEQTFKRIDFDDLGNDDRVYLEEEYSLEYIESFAVKSIEDEVINNGLSFVGAVDKIMNSTYWIIKEDINSDSLYIIVNPYNETIFFIDENILGGYTAYNGMGIGQWECSTIEECIRTLEDAYGDTILGYISI